MAKKKQVPQDKYKRDKDGYRHRKISEIKVSLREPTRDELWDVATIPGFHDSLYGIDKLREELRKKGNHARVKKGKK